jgi:N-acetylglucosamine-6-phosphate deacetylase
MSNGEIIARHHLNGRPFLLAWRQGRITRFECINAKAPADLFIAPALFDPQINGYAGVDFQQENLTADDLLKAVHALRQDGCARFLLTLITDKWPSLIAKLHHFRSLRAAHPELQTAIAGWHVEGPFLSSEPGFCGAHDPALMQDPQPEQIRTLRQVTGQDPVLLTIAPERSGAIPAIQLAATLGIKISLGHTDASLELLAAAVRAGAIGFTHLANGCPHALNRHDNILWRVLETKGLFVSFIPDGAHVSPAPFRLLHRLLDPAKIYYTTDAMAAAGQPPGRYIIGKLTVEVGADQIVRLPGTPYYAGSALRPCEGIMRASQMLGCHWTDCWQRSSLVPAKFMGLPAGLHVGGAANFVLVQTLSRGDETCLRIQPFDAWPDADGHPV